METKTFILSSSGLQNIIFTKDASESEEFRFILGEEELKTKNLFAEFISPRVSRIHQTDPTLNFLNLTERGGTNQPINKQILSKIDELSRGNKIEVTEEMTNDLQRISILLGNEELFSKIDDLFDEPKSENDRISKALQSLQFIENEEFCIQRSEQHESIIDYISSHFYLIEEEKLLKIPKPILYMIINNEHLKLNDEDSLFDFINKIFYSDQEQEKDKEQEYENMKIQFYENVEFKALSEEKMNEFLNNFNASEMTNTLWRKLIECFYSNSNIVKEMKTVEERMSLQQTRYSKKTKTFEYNQNKHFNGIFNYFGEKTNGIISNDVDITSSSAETDSRLPINVVQYNNNSRDSFYSKNQPNQWICFDLKNHRVIPSCYEIKSSPFQANNHHPKSWVIEGSNDNKNWITIDEQNNCSSLNGNSIIYSFSINNKKNQSFRYIKFRLTGVSWYSSNIFMFHSFELYGTLI